MRQGMAVRAATGGMSLLSTAPDGRMNRSRRSVTARTDIPKRTDPRRGRSGATEALNGPAGRTEAGPEAPRLESQLRSDPQADAGKVASGSRPNSSLAQANAGADFHLVPVDRGRLRACSSPRPTDLRTLGRAAAFLGIPAVSVRRQLSTTACRGHCRHGRPARADSPPKPLSFPPHSTHSLTSYSPV